MLKELFKKEEKKVEYIELIYDLIFVYIIGRNNSLIHHTKDGFIPADMFLTYLLTTLIVLQVWYYTTVFINRYGTNGAAEYVMLFINMYLLYYMADSTTASWRDQYNRYNIAWAMILLNIAVQYFLKLRKCPGSHSLLRQHILFNIVLLASEAAVVLLSIPLYHATGLPLSPIAMVAGVLITLTLGSRYSKRIPVDFGHLSERVMLYVVFTFGEMIIGIAGYFSGEFTLRNVYFSLMGFLIVAGLFLIYGYYYDHVIDREQCTNGVGYMMIHILLITMLNNITAALEFMREPEVDEVRKNAFLVISFVLYFTFLFLTLCFAKSYHKPSRRFLLIAGGLTVLFAVMMAAFYRDSIVSISVTVCYIYAMLALNIISGIRASHHHKLHDSTDDKESLYECQ